MGNCVPYQENKSFQKYSIYGRSCSRFTWALTCQSLGGGGNRASLAPLVTHKRGASGQGGEGEEEELREEAYMVKIVAGSERLRRVCVPGVVGLWICLSVCLSIYLLSVCLFIYLSMYR